ncbi:hypothetical protein ACFYU9_15975 [Streptomyces sp. NPDC004327]
MSRTLIEELKAALAGATDADLLVDAIEPDGTPQVAQYAAMPAPQTPEV